MKSFNVCTRVRLLNFEISPHNHTHNSINIGFNCSIAFPDSFERTLRSLKIVNLDLVPSLGLQCDFDFDYIHKMLSVTLGPLAVAAMLGLVYFVVTTAEARKTKERLGERMATYEVPAELLHHPNSFGSDDIEKSKRVFAVADCDGSGSIDKDELKTIVETFTPGATSEEIDALVGKMMNEGDAAEDGEISFGEFMHIIHQARHEHKGGKFSELLDKMDASVNKSTGTIIVYLFLLLTFLVLISSSTTIFHFFKCDAFDVPDEDGGGTVSYLAKDLSLDCDSNRYKGFVGYAVIMILVYPIGEMLLDLDLIGRLSV